MIFLSFFKPRGWVDEEWVEKRIRDFFEPEAKELTDLMNRVHVLEMELRDLKEDKKKELV